MVRMTTKRCTDCRHTRGIGFDFWCGEGHTEYEVFGAETNCPYYEYHDWSKGVPSMTTKRFETNMRLVIDTEKKYGARVLNAEEVVDLLNTLNDENEQLQKQLSDVRKENYGNLDGINYYQEQNASLSERISDLECENEQLKEEIARQKYTKHIMRENIKRYEREIKGLRKSFEKFDEMRLDRIRFLEKKLKKNGLSIYVNDCGDLE